MDWNTGGTVWPIVEVLDNGNYFYASNPEELTAREAGDSYAQWQEIVEPREVQLRQFTSSGGAGAWETLSVPYVAPPPLENLEWNQGWPSFNGVDLVDVVDDSTHFKAENPEGWDLARCAADYGASYACENKTPHEVQVRTVTANGNGEFEPFTVPVEE